MRTLWKRISELYAITVLLINGFTKKIQIKEVSQVNAVDIFNVIDQRQGDVGQ